MVAIMQSEAGATRQCKTLCVHNPEYVPIHTQPFLIGSCASYRLPSRAQYHSNTPTGTFLHIAADSEDAQSTLTSKGNASEIEIMETTAMKELGRLSVDPTLKNGNRSLKMNQNPSSPSLILPRPSHTYTACVRNFTLARMQKTLQVCGEDLQKSQ